jgi:hypothetical protein
LSRPTPPPNLVASISNALYIEAAARRQAPKPSPVSQLAGFLKPRLMPYTVGSFASVFMFFMMFTALRPHFVVLREVQAQYRPDLTKPVTPESFARERAPFGVLSPTIDPNGSLAALQRANAHPAESQYDPDDDMLVMAYVFSNGTASLGDVVHPPRDKRMLDDFQSALRRDYAFVEAKLDHRPDTMRIYFWCRGGAVERVEVDGRN